VVKVNLLKQKMQFESQEKAAACFFLDGDIFMQKEIE